ncbi:hypothetical protein [Streptomyces sp. H39-S7]|uniref:hypothetical protein n=1 Tax=Streptomyces sp. H39-S7 TaxID=3004357 RepID=UPI0022AF3F97|nr:hypothetical protein [Streptomyces sp. H39-S7]MCZ4119044.1 hypothetical protein [Streptomyces sp. H39-S7]
MQIKTWTDAYVSTDDLNTELVDNLNRLIAQPACRRTFAANLTANASGAWLLVPLDPVGTGEGRFSSFDTSSGAFGANSNRMTAPEDGLYEITFSAVIRAAVSATSLTYGAAAIAVNQATATNVAANALCRTALNRSWGEERSGNGSATVPLLKGDYVSLATTGIGTTWVTGHDSFTEMTSFLCLSRVGEKP